jgi:RNA polymerase-interacting CarD/CdnL/TRCF family regulator
MQQKIHSFKSLLFLLIVGLPIILIGQNSDKNTITYTSPSKDYLDITIQSHKGLPRFGEIYYERGVTPPTNQGAYRALIKMKYLKAIYADIDKNKLTSYDRTNSNLKDANSRFAQNDLLQLAGMIVSDALLQKYFCDKPTTTKCIFNTVYGRKPIRNWGGSRTNQFQQMRGYRSFVKDHLEALQNWSNTFFKGDQEIVYVVSRSAVSGKYDFKQKGYWIRNEAPFTTYTESERKFKNRKVLISIPTAKAKELNLRDRVPLFAVYKVKALPKVNQTHFEFSFELVSKTIEFYKDPALTKKIGQINLDNAIFKY